MAYSGTPEEQRAKLREYKARNRLRDNETAARCRRRHTITPEERAKHTERQRRWRALNPLKVREYDRRRRASGAHALYAKSHAAEGNARARRWAKMNPLKVHATRKRQVLKTKDWRLQAIHALGGECTECGVGDERVLQFDHKVPLLGCKARVGRIKSYKAIVDGSADYDLLCANCHVIKTRENGEYGQRTVKLAARREGAR